MGHTQNVALPMMDLALQIFVSVVVGVSVFLPIFAVFRFPVPTEPPVHRQLASSMGLVRETVFEQPLLAPAMSLGLMWAQRFGVMSLRQRIRRQLQASGNPSGYSVEEYLAICLLSATALALVGGLTQLMLGGGAFLLLMLPILACLGFYAPLWSLDGAARKRLRLIARQLPYTLDLIALTLAAGASFNEAVQTLVRDRPDDALNQELQMALMEIEFGATRSAALQSMADRVPIEALRSVVGALNQADRLGTPLSVVLKLQADMMRVRRSVDAEKKSASASLRILVPSMLIMMAVVVIVFGPILIRLLKGELF